MDTQNALKAFAERVEDDHAIMPATGMLPAVHIRPVGAQAITIRRNPSQVLQSLKTFAAAAGDDWYYSWDVNDKHSKRPDGKTTIEGPSVKLANDLARLYGNCTVEVARVDDTGTHWVFYARFVDFETGYEYTRPFQQRKAQGQGQGMNADRQQDIAFQIGASKAVRNCVVNALGTFSDFAMSEAKQAIIGKVHAKLADYRERVIERLNSYGVLARVEKTLAVTAPSWDAPTVAKLIAQLQAVKEGMTTIAELYPDPDAPSPDENKPKQLETFAEGKTKNEGDAGKSEAVVAKGTDPTTKRTRRTVPAKDQARDEAEKSVDAPIAAGEAPVGERAEPAPKTGQAISSGAERVGPDDHDPETGEVTEDIPTFLKRSAPEKIADEAELFKTVRERHPTMSPLWHRGYVARARGASKTDVPNELAPMAIRHWGAGWDARDMEDEDGKEAENQGQDANGAGGQ
jgi:hypothetical protein